MTPTGRRALLRLAAGCALAPAFAGRLLAHDPGNRDFAPPAAPMRYTRRLVRKLGGGYQMSVARSFTVRFAALPTGGYAVDGEQFAVEVAAPERMAAFAELERRRVETGVFPLRLDGRGVIERGPEQHSSRLLDEAVAQARRLVGERAVPAAERAEAEAFVQLVHRVATDLAAYLPADLFAPTEHRRVEQRSIDLPSTSGGEVEVVFTADADPRTGLMNRARREIVTSIAGDRRTTEEDWMLDPL